MSAVHDHSRQLTSGTIARLATLGSDDARDGPLYAINWFNTRFPVLYALYTRLASMPLKSTRARLFFRGKHRSLISGPDGQYRSTLLIVEYPSGGRFLDLLSNRFFQIISVLRNLAVDKFSFVLNKRVNLPGPAAGENERHTAYAVHHFSSHGELSGEMTRILALLKGSGVRVFLSSEKSAQVVLERETGATEALPYVTNKVVIYSAPDFAELELALQSKDYLEFCAGTSWSYIATLERTG